MNDRCTVCGALRKHAFDATVLRRHRVAYLYCDTCGLLQTERPWWLDEAYGQAIADLDTGVIGRNLVHARIAASVLAFLFDRRGRFVDVAGGYGLFVRRMRDLGFDFYWEDKHCENLVARGFEWREDRRPATVATAFEVLEHVEDPVEFLRGVLERAGTRSIFFSTLLFDGPPPDPKTWWYYSLDTGQHISFFQRLTLTRVAGKLGLRFLSNGSNLHLITDQSVNPVIFRLLAGRIGYLLADMARFGLESKRGPDHQLLAGRSS